MRHLWMLLALLCAGFVVPAHSEVVTPADQAAIQDVITRQIEAFRRDDGQAAYAIAAPSIQKMFGSPERFMDMVRNAYPAVHRPRSFQFTDLVSGQGETTQDVELIGPDGQPARAHYTLEKDPTGSWRIAGCEMLKSERLAV